MRDDDKYFEIFGERKLKEKYNLVGHRFDGVVAGKRYCIDCGLISSTNRFTRWATEKGCKNNLHPSYENERRKVGK